MSRTLVVTHSSDERDGVLWKVVLDQYPEVDLVAPIFRNSHADTTWLQPFVDKGRAYLLPALEPAGKGHSSLWIKGINSLVNKGHYSLLHAAMEPWALIPQYFVKRIPTVVQGAESIVIEAPWQLRLRRMGLRRVLRNVAGLAAWGRTSVEAFEKAGLPKSTPRAVIPMGIPDPNVFARTPLPSLGNGINILYVGRLDPEKGVSTLINAFRDWGLRKTTLRIVGSGPEEPVLRAMAREVQTIQITFDGTAGREGVYQAMQWAHVVVVPSLITNRWKEQWGRVPVEAMLSGRACLVSDSGELPFISPVPGSVFAHGDDIALMRRLHHIVSDSQRLNAIADEQYASARRFRAEALAESLAELWRKARHQRKQP